MDTIKRIGSVSTPPEVGWAVESVKESHQTAAPMTDDRPVIYIDLPDGSDSTDWERQRDVRRKESTEKNMRIHSETGVETEQPVIYIDMPENEAVNWLDDTTITYMKNKEPNDCSPRQQKQKEDEDTPRIYIDIPENTINAESGPQSTVSQSARDQGSRNDDRSFLQNTIFYDPFDDRRIDQTQAKDRPQPGPSQAGPSGAPPGRPPRPPPPNSLSLSTYSAVSGTSSSISYLPHRTPDSTPGYSYSRPSPEDGLTLHPLPVQDYRDPPPAYTDIDRGFGPEVLPSSHANTIINMPITNQPQSTPGTEASVIGIPSPDRKCVECPNCRAKVHTLRVSQIGLLTHVAAITCMMFCMIPIALLIYATSCMKYKHHYCPNCNKLIGYAFPCATETIIYMKPSDNV